MRTDEISALLPEKNPAFEVCKAKFWVAYRNNECVGRIGGIIIPLWIEKTGEKIGRFTRPEFVNDIEVAKALFSKVEEWLRNEGMDGMHGPMGFSNLDHQGLLIEGQDWLPSVASIHFAYYQEIYEQLGFQKLIGKFHYISTSMPKKQGCRHAAYSTVCVL
jgi:hypothetical protein